MARSWSICGSTGSSRPRVVRSVPLGSHERLIRLQRDEDVRAWAEVQLAVALLREVDAHDRAPFAFELDAHERAGRIDHQHRRAELARVGPAKADLQQV